jgi:hypothetical protein
MYKQVDILFTPCSVKSKAWDEESKVTKHIKMKEKLGKGQREEIQNKKNT